MEALFSDECTLFLEALFIAFLIFAARYVSAKSKQKLPQRLWKSYGLMLDRMALSLKNGWLDALNRVYIYFTLEDVQEYMNCQRDKGMKLLAELDAAKGAGLIERVRQGLGRPTIIYVKKFIAGTDLLKSEKPTSGLPDMLTSGLADTPTPARRKNRPLEVGGTDPNNNKINNTDLKLRPVRRLDADVLPLDLPALFILDVPALPSPFIH
ncbi:MAG TPA: hypothetical protein DEQ02_06395 [Ruminococcaceae bacterium]|nr:hypothetical protein [Oscillospiraceae bacterium]